MRTPALGLASLVLIALLVVGFDGFGCVSRLARRDLLDRVHRGCPGCEFALGSLELLPLRGILRIGDLRYRSAPGDGTALAVRIARMQVRFAPLSLWSRWSDAPRLSDVLVEGAEVSVEESAGSPPSTRPDFPATGDAFGGLPPLRVGGVALRDGAFSYRLRTFGQVAVIHVGRIQAGAGPFVTRAALTPADGRAPVRLWADAQLEQSGQVRLRVDFDPFARKNLDHVELQVRNQRLAELDPFFSVEDGIRLRGWLRDGHARMQIADGHLSGMLRCAYRDIGLDFHPTPDRGRLSTFLTSVVQSLALKKTTRPANARDRPEAPIDYPRARKQTVPKFLLEGLKAAMFKILTS